MVNKAGQLAVLYECHGSGMDVTLQHADSNSVITTPSGHLRRVDSHPRATIALDPATMPSEEAAAELLEEQKLSPASKQPSVPSWCYCVIYMLLRFLAGPVIVFFVIRWYLRGLFGDYDRLCLRQTTEYCAFELLPLLLHR